MDRRVEVEQAARLQESLRRHGQALDPAAALAVVELLGRSGGGEALLPELGAALRA